MWSSILASIAKFFSSLMGYKEKKEENFDKHELKKLDEDAIELHTLVLAALDSGNPDLLRQRQDAYDLNRKRAKALRGA